MKRTRTYLDWAAAAPVSPAARRAYMRGLALAGNPSSPHTEGREARALLEDARVRIARLAEVKPDAVLFTSGATEANALAILGSIQALVASGREPASMHALYWPGSHASVVESMHALARLGVAIEPIRAAGGAIDLDALRSQARPETVLVSVDAVCGETGAMHAVRDVRRALPEGSRILLHVDAAQAPFARPYELTRLGADMLTLDAQKAGGVRGIGALIAPRSVKLSPLYRGGGQERGLRPGTESPALASAFALALEEAGIGREAFARRAELARARLITQLSAIPRLVVNEGSEQAPHILNLSLPGRDTDYIVALMDEAGFALSTKSACESDSEEGSRAVLALTLDPVRAASTLRISWGHTTRPRDLERAGQALMRAVKFVDENAIMAV